MAIPLQPPTGQDPISVLPQYGGAGGGSQAAQYYAGQYFNQLFGRNPTQSELSQFAPYFMGGDPNIANVTGGDQAISSYYNQAQQAANAPQQESQALQQQIPIIQNLVQGQTDAQTKNLLDPNSSTYQQFSGLLNNMGITPSSGAFQAGVGGTLAQNSANATNAALGAVGLPIASGYSQGAMAPFQQAMQQPQEQFSNNMQLQNMLQEMQAAAGISSQASPSAFQQAMGMASGGAQGAGSLLQGGAQAYKATWICTQLCEKGLLTPSEVNQLHRHLYRAKWKRPFKFLGYFLFGRLLVGLANSVGTHWGTWKPEFYDRVMEEPDPIKAVDLYADAFWHLYANVKWRREFFYGF